MCGLIFAPQSHKRHRNVGKKNYLAQRAVEFSPYHTEDDTMSSNTQKPILQRSIAYGAPYAYEKLAEAEKNPSIQSSISLVDSGDDGGSGVKNNGTVVLADDVTLGSISSVMSSSNRSVSSSDDECSYSYSYSIESVESSSRYRQKSHGGRLGATPDKGGGRGGFTSLSPVKKREDNDTLDIPGCSDWSFDISRMSMPAVAERDDEAIAQDANLDAAVATREDSPNESPRTESTDNDNAITFSAQLESLALRLLSLEKAIYRSANDTLPRMSDAGDHNMAFIVEEEDSTVESHTNGIVLSEARKGRRAKPPCLLRFFFFGGCRKL